MPLLSRIIDPGNKIMSVKVFNGLVCENGIFLSNQFREINLNQHILAELVAA